MSFIFTLNAARRLYELRQDIEIRCESIKPNDVARILTEWIR